MNKIIPLLVALLSVAGCQQSHLEIFPPLENEQLMVQKFSVEQMREDIDAFVDGAISRHPDIQEYAELRLLKDKAAQLKSGITHPLTRTEFYRVVGQLSPYFQDGHSFLLWPYQELNKALDAGHKKFPLAVLITNDGRLQIKHSYRLNSTQVPRLSEIKSINGVDSETIVAKLMSYAGGETELLRRHSVAMRFGTSLWASYGWLDTFNVEISSPNGIQSISINPQYSWPVASESTHQSADKAHYYLQLSDEVGFIYLAHFDVPIEEFSQFIDHTFATIRKQNIQQLIIDVRDNPGGNTDTVTYLARHFARLQCTKAAVSLPRLLCC
ncbi:S41 family peptidase [Pseudoalteromonas sp. SSDWG2]|uniref:S41 family peptidase n=1 Tax=Pseudoalteromonas sp. SSDWG2 TaxID=3139391 RepID=UPI003BA91912